MREFREIPSFEDYVINLDGYVLKKNNFEEANFCFLKAYKCNVTGKLKVTLKRTKEGKKLKSTAYVHTLVGKTFIPVFDLKRKKVWHINGDIYDNSVENLKWVPLKGKQVYNYAPKKFVHLNRLYLPIERLPFLSINEKGDVLSFKSGKPKKIKQRANGKIMFFDTEDYEGKRHTIYPHVEVKSLFTKKKPHLI
ncbi:hypothetical protein [Flammeovirga kamogawensis]|uniref:HNH endonuclease n=1 Tax=Flammeovirga kamogawensis TaxID=373891 RepID=A0ABX8H297_9BACT|nr:hypothetical protein [Flammeovirga kamogawensis]MBB6462558.1 hypothetical protein [Flammeovirga kamogawensis]QWG09692.1 hypothetical protein KM029_24115 [Flammeovirga kamogawensis]TRX65204.1 hypothetical protein EO216_22010 [Flammeovirga kamogawensis]